VGLFFAAKLYRMNLLTIGDYYRLRYNAHRRGACEPCHRRLLPRLALGADRGDRARVQVVTGGAVSMNQGILIGAAVVLVYTLWGGMFSVAWTNFVQMVVIVIGLGYIALLLADKAGGVGTVISHAHAAGKLEFWPKPEGAKCSRSSAAWITMMFGSIPQQDVFQRVNASRTERIAAYGSVLGGVAVFPASPSCRSSSPIPRA
jgi:solute:Na+ symporter, SSS family